MTLLMFSIFDNKADAFNTPFFMAARGQAVRAFQDLVNDGQSAISKHPEDYKLCLIGEFNVLDAEFTPAGVVSLGFGSDFVERKSALREIRDAAAS